MDLLLHGEIGVDHFEREEDGAVVLTDEGREIFIRAMRERMLEVHPYVEGVANSTVSFILLISK
mgnify:CR=1 FL=1